MSNFLPSSGGGFNPNAFPITTSGGTGGIFTSGGFADILSSGTSGGGFNAGSLVTTGLDAIFPGAGTAFSMLGGVLGMDFQTEINNVFAYGPSSWGATTTPDGIGPFLAEFETYNLSLIANMSNGDIETNLNELSRFNYWGIQFYHRMRANHANAGSTKAAYDLAKDFFNKQLGEVIAPLVAQLKSLNIIISTQQVNVSANNYLHLGLPVNQNDPQIGYMHHAINQDAVINAFDTFNSQQSQNVNQNQNDNLNTPPIENPSQDKKSSGLGILASIGAYLIFK